MTITQNNDNGKLTIVLEGWLDHSSSPELGDVIEGIESAKEIILDFAKVEYVSSAGIRQIVATHRKAKELDADFSVINVNPEVKSIIAITGLDKKIDISGQN